MFALPTNVGFAQRVVATLVAVAILLMSIGWYQQVEAANFTQVSDLLSDSAPGVASNHTITFSTPTGIANGDIVSIDFSDGPFVVGSVDFEDIDVSVTGTGDLSVEASCTTEDIGASFSGTILTLEFCAAGAQSVAAFGTTTIEIGTNATFGVTGASQLTNPGVGSYEITITTDNPAGDTGATRVAIVNTVTVTASVPTIFDFTITGLATSTVVNGTSTTGSTSPTAIPFGEVVQDEIKTLAQRLNVTTNARNGFVVTVEQDQNLLSSTGADIDAFTNGNYQNTPIAWAPPSESVTQENTWGHWGLTSSDDLNSGEYLYCAASSTYGCWVAASTSPREVFAHDGPADGSTASIGSTTVGYQIEITGLQEAGDDYTTTLTYIATPTF